MSSTRTENNHFTFYAPNMTLILFVNFPRDNLYPQKAFMLTTFKSAGSQSDLQLPDNVC